MLVPLYPHIPKHEKACNETWGATAEQDLKIQKNIIAIRGVENYFLQRFNAGEMYHNFMVIE